MTTTDGQNKPALEPDSLVSAVTPGAPRELPAAAQRALREAEERRRARLTSQTNAPAEVGGRKGPDPVRYGDWEKDGIASDF